MNKSINALRWPTLLGLLLLAGISSAFGQIITQPAGLTPGAQYRLVFVTNGTTAATSTAITTYNAFVTTEAGQAPSLLNLGTTWSMIGSTASVSAITNTGTSPGTGVPIYGLNGAEIASTYTQLWSGTLLSPIEYTQTGATLISSIVWTGTNATGASNSSFPLGGGSSIVGETGSSSASWIDFANGTGGSAAVYAVSGVLTAAPEPGSATLLVTGMLALASRRRRRARDPQAMR